MMDKIDHLVYLASMGDLSSIKPFLSSDLECEIEAETVQHMTEAAAKGAHIQTIQYLLSAFPSVPISEATVKAAANTSSIQLFKALLDKDASIVNMEYSSRGTPLTWSTVLRAPLEFLAFLLCSGADPNQDVDRFASPLALAANRYKTLEAVGLLLQHGARLAGSAALHFAVLANNMPMAQYLFEQGATVDSDVGVPPLSPLPPETALHCAVEKGYGDWVKLLLEHGGDPNMKDASNRTPLEIAEAKGDGEMVELLKRHVSRAVSRGSCIELDKQS